MNIIFGDSAKQIPDCYTVLELDTFSTVGGDQTFTAYCLVEKMAMDECANMEAHKKIHADLIAAYRNQHWNYCEQAIAGLTGKWNGEIDTFYTDLLNRVKQHKENGVPSDWTATIVKDTV
jgi:hypothetical protein